MLADTLGKVETKKLGYTLGDVKAEALVNKISYTEAAVTTKVLGKTLKDVETKALDKTHWAT